MDFFTDFAESASITQEIGKNDILVFFNVKIYVYLSPKTGVFSSPNPIAPKMSDGMSKTYHILRFFWRPPHICLLDIPHTFLEQGGCPEPI